MAGMIWNLARRIRRKPLLLALGLFISVSSCSPRSEGPGAMEWTPAEGLKTRWAAEVDAGAPLPEYPRPQLVRPEWTNLNGLWELAILPRSQGPAQDYPERILVPYPVESALSGIARRVDPEEKIWYRRTFSLGVGNPAPGPHSRWILHFGAVDWEAEVFLNGTSLGTHRGGYDPFAFDITDHIRESESQELVVSAWDPTDTGQQPRGKQVLDPHGIWYTAVSGIWQTVWLEEVPTVYVAGLQIEAKPDAGRVEVEVAVNGTDEPVSMDIVLLAQGRPIGGGEGLSGAPLTLSIPDVRPWSPDDPFLYGIRVSLRDPRQGGNEEANPVGDVVESYFGMRSISVEEDDGGHQRLLLNGEPLFQYGLLDQGWWPDGLYTAPTDEALRFDVEMTKELGFNLIRKHVKVEPARWYYHCDREGILVWQDMPSGDNESPGAREQFAAELEAVVSSLRNHPSIVMWVPFNEGWGQHDTESYVRWLEEVDPGRLVNNASGWTDTGTGNVLDIHRYPGPGNPLPDTMTGPRAPEGGPAPARAGVLGEFGGLGLPLSGHTWVEEDNWGYRSFETLEALNQAYRDLITQLRPLIGEGLAAAVYTQTTDVEVEVNGVMTYDREVVKLGEGARELHEALFQPPPTLRPVVPTSRNEARIWRFTTTDPGSGWGEPGFDDEGWQEGPGGFGTEGTPGARIGTVWDTQEIWVRRSFALTDQDVQGLEDARLYLRIHHDEDAEVFLNGAQVAGLEGYTADYRLVPLEPDRIDLLAPGENLLAIHVTQTRGGQYIDAGIVEWVEAGG